MHLAGNCISPSASPLAPPHYMIEWAKYSTGNLSSAFSRLNSVMRASHLGEERWAEGGDPVSGLLSCLCFRSTLLWKDEGPASETKCRYRDSTLSVECRCSRFTLGASHGDGTVAGWLAGFRKGSWMMRYARTHTHSRTHTLGGCHRILVG